MKTLRIASAGQCPFHEKIHKSVRQYYKATIIGKYPGMCSLKRCNRVCDYGGNCPLKRNRTIVVNLLPDEPEPKSDAYPKARSPEECREYVRSVADSDSCCAVMSMAWDYDLMRAAKQMIAGDPSKAIYIRVCYMGQGSYGTELLTEMPHETRRSDS